MKDFNDFKKLLTQEYFVSLATIVNGLDIKTAVRENSSLTQDDINDLSNLFMSANIIVLTAFLEKYHDWLNSDQ